MGAPSLSAKEEAILRVLKNSIMVVDTHFVAQSVNMFLQSLNVDWRLEGRWGSSDQLWAEIRPYLVDRDGIRLDVVRRLANLNMKMTVAPKELTMLAIRWAAFDWANAQTTKKTT